MDMEMLRRNKVVVRQATLGEMARFRCEREAAQQRLRFDLGERGYKRRVAQRKRLQGSRKNIHQERR